MTDSPPPGRRRAPQAAPPRRRQEPGQTGASPGPATAKPPRASKAAAEASRAAEAARRARAAEPSASAAVSPRHAVARRSARRWRQLSLNLARAAMTAQGAIAEAALRQADRPAALTPDPFHVAPALTEVMGRLAAQPDRLMRAQADLFSRYMDLWQTAAERVAGESRRPVVEPGQGRQALRRSRLDRQPGVRRDQAVLPAHLQLAERAGRRRRGRRPDDQAAGRVLHEDAHRRLLAVELPALQPGGAARGDARPSGESLVKGMENFAADLRARRRPAVDQPDRLHASSRSARTSPPRRARWSSRTS